RARRRTLPRRGQYQNAACGISRSRGHRRSKTLPDQRCIAIRLLYILLAALTVAFTFQIALEFLESPAVALLAAALMLSVYSFLRFNGGGVQPKTPMVLFGLLSLLAIVRDRPATAGVFGWPATAGVFAMLSMLSWQPGLLFVGAGVLSFSRYLT